MLAWQIADSGGPQWLGWIAARCCFDRAGAVLRAPHRASARHQRSDRARGGDARFCADHSRLLRIHLGRMAAQLAAADRTILALNCSACASPRRGRSPFCLGSAVTIGMILFLNLSRLGLSMRALANDRDISGLVGVPVLRVDAWAWVISGVLSGVSGIFLANMVRLQIIPLTYMVIPAVAAAILGRLTSLTAVVIGGLVIGVLEAVASPFPEVSAYRSATPFVVAGLALLWFQRGGLMLSRMDQFRSVATSHQPPSSLWQELRVGIVLAVDCRHRRSLSGIGLLAQDVHRRHHHFAVQPQRRGALRPARHGVALPIRAARRRRLGRLAPLPRISHSV